MSDTPELNQDELTTLKARADLMGLQYHPSIGVEKLKEKIAAATSATPSPALGPTAAPPITPVEVAPEPVVETEAQLRKRLKNEALALIRIRLTCMNPLKKDWEGEIITVGNSYVGTISKFVPFNAEDGWHVPRIMLDMLMSRQFQTFVNTKSKNGVSQRQGKLVKEFAIEVLPPLTQDELHDLAQRQAMAQSVG
jgi:hypothetical protein